MKKNEIYNVGNIKFMGIKVPIYYDKYTTPNNPIASWQIRNPDSCYQGLLFMNTKNGEISLPDDAIIPKQTNEDREIIPKFIICGLREISDEFKNKTLVYLVNRYKKINGIN